MCLGVVATVSHSSGDFEGNTTTVAKDSVLKTDLSAMQQKFSNAASSITYSAAYVHPSHA